MTLYIYRVYFYKLFLKIAEYFPRLYESIFKHSVEVVVGWLGIGFPLLGGHVVPGPELEAG